MQNFYISDWEAFDWIENKRKKEIGSIIHSDMAKIYFNINLALIGILDNSLDFYIQVFLNFLGFNLKGKFCFKLSFGNFKGNLNSSTIPMFSFLFLLLV